MDEYWILARRKERLDAQQMGISRTTVTEIYESARYKLADSVVNGKKLHISGGNYCFCDGTDTFCCNRNCKRTENSTSHSKKRRKTDENWCNI